MFAPEPFFEPRGTPFSEYHRIRALCELELRARYGLRPDQPVVLYTGTFEPYPGARSAVRRGGRARRHASTRARVLVAGGTRDQVEDARRRAGAAGSPLIFAGQRPAHEIPAFLAACDVLVSPRTSGTNTPLKIYSCLRSGRPIVATDLRTHTQVLDAGTALLVPPVIRPGAKGLATI